MLMRALIVLACGWAFAGPAAAQHGGQDVSPSAASPAPESPQTSPDHSAPDPMVRPRFVLTEDFPDADDSAPPAGPSASEPAPTPRGNTFAAKPAPVETATPAVNRFQGASPTPASATRASAKPASTATAGTSPAPRPAIVPPPPPVVAAVSRPGDDDQPAYLEGIPQAAAAAHVLREVCLPLAQGEGPLGELLPPKAEQGIGPVETRMSGRPLAGRVFALRSLEESFLVGEVDGRPGACQMLVPSPFSDAVIAAFAAELTKTAMGFKQQGAPVDRGNGITWVRYWRAEDGLVADIVAYPGVGGGTTATVQIVVD